MRYRVVLGLCLISVEFLVSDALPTSLGSLFFIFIFFYIVKYYIAVHRYNGEAIEPLCLFFGHFLSVQSIVHGLDAYGLDDCSWKFLSNVGLLAVSRLCVFALQEVVLRQRPPTGATRGVTVSMSAFLACHQCYCAGSSLAWGLNLRAVVFGIF